MKEQNLNLENKAIITMAQFKEYEELKQNIGSVRISIGDWYVGYHDGSQYCKYLSLETHNIPNEILEELKSKVDGINKYLFLNEELNIELERIKYENVMLNRDLTGIKSKWWYKLFNKE